MSLHPLARFDHAQRILPHTLVDLCDQLGADTFSLDGIDLAFRRRARGDQPATVWQARLGDWAVQDDDGVWHIEADSETIAATVAPVARRPRVLH